MDKEKELLEKLKDVKITKIRGQGRERKGSLANVGVMEMWKRKREVSGEGEGDEGEGDEERMEAEVDFSQGSKKTARSPVKVKGDKRKEQEVAILGMTEGGMKDGNERWERMEEDMKKIMRELEAMRKREKEWRVERKRMEKRIEELEKKWEKGLATKEGEKETEELEESHPLVSRLEKGGGEKGGKEEEGSEKVEERIRKVEWEWERKERQERKRNVVVKGYREEGKDARGKVEEIFRKIGAEVKIEEVRAVKKGREEWGGLAVVKLRSEEERKEVMRKKKELKGEKIWITDDLTWRERQSKWKFQEAVRGVERKGGNVWWGDKKALINGEWWFWDEEEEILRDRLGRRREGEETRKAGEKERRA